MMLEEKQRKGNAAESATEAECRDLEQTLSTAGELLEGYRRQKKQLVENLDKEKEESRKLKEVEKSISSASRKTPQQVGLFIKMYFAIDVWAVVILGCPI